MLRHTPPWPSPILRVSQAKLMALTTMRLKTRQFRRNLQGYSWHTEVELEKVLGWEKTHGGNLLGVWCMFLLTEPIYIFRIPYPVKLWGPKSKGQWSTASNASWRRTGLHCMCLFVYVKFVNRTAPLFTATGPILKRFEKLVMLSTNQTINPFPWQSMPKEKIHGATAIAHLLLFVQHYC